MAENFETCRIKYGNAFSVETETGSTYEFDLKKFRVARVPASNKGDVRNTMRKDNQETEILDMSVPEVGKPVEMLLKGVSDIEDVATFRTTSPVVRIF